MSTRLLILEITILAVCFGHTRPALCEEIIVVPVTSADKFAHGMSSFNAAAAKQLAVDQKAAVDAKSRTKKPAVSGTTLVPGSQTPGADTPATGATSVQGPVRRVRTSN